jgi:hypothetical protein
MVRLKNEITAMKVAEEEAAAEKAEMEAYLADKNPEFHKSEE